MFTLAIIYIRNRNNQNMGFPFERWNLHLKLPIDSAKSNMVTPGENLFKLYANNKGADQPAHPLPG